MGRWITALRDQVARLSTPGYQPDARLFVGAPEDILNLSRDLDAMAEDFAERERARQALTHEVHHRVKNNLQIVTSLLKLQARAMTDPQSRQPLEQAQLRMGALAMIHRLVYEKADEGSSSRVDVERLFAGLGSQLRSAFRHQDNVALSFTIHGGYVPLDDAVPLTLFAVEAVSNAYRHGFPDDGVPGTIDLTFSDEDGTIVLSVRDDGVGFNALTGGSTLGHQLLTAFAHQLGGAMVMTGRGEGAGAVVTLTYPRKQAV